MSVTGFNRRRREIAEIEAEKVKKESKKDNNKSKKVNEEK